MRGVSLHEEARRALTNVEETNARAWTALMTLRDAEAQYARAKRNFRLSIAHAESLNVTRKVIYETLSGEKRFASE